MKGIIFAPQYDRPPDEHNPGGHDSTWVFKPGATVFADANTLPDPIFFNNHLSDPKCRESIEHEILTATGLPNEIPYTLDVIAYFGHGIKSGIVSAGFYIADIPELATTISSKAGNGVVVALYACSAGATDGFASKLATALSAKSATVYGHTDVGHAFTNPNVRKFPGGDFVIGPKDALWKKWCAVLENSRLDPYNNNRLWAEFPFLSDTELRVALQAIPELLGRWEVHYPDATYHYIFFPDHTAYWTYPETPLKKEGEADWWFTDSGVWVSWDMKTIEVWDTPIKLKAQTGRLLFDSRTFTARRKDNVAISMKHKKKFT